MNGWSLESKWQENDFASSRFLIAEQKIIKGQNFWMGFEIKLADHWHSYWVNPGDAGFPPKIDFSQSKGIKNVQIYYPLPNRYSFEGDLVGFGYDQQVIYPIKIETDPDYTGDEIQLDFKIQYLVCEKTCVPYKSEFKISVLLGDPLSESIDTIAQEKIRSAIDLIPIPFQDQFKITESYDETTQVFTIRMNNEWVQDIYFYPHSKLSFLKPELQLFANDAEFKIPVQLMQSDLSIQQILTDEPVQYVLKIQQGHNVTGIYKTWDKLHLLTKPLPRHHWLWMFLLSILGGMILNFMPCVLPVLSIKIFSLMQKLDSKNHEIRMSSFMTLLGILSSFWVLAGVLIILKEGGESVGWGIQFQRPDFLIFLILVVFFFALNLFGFFEIQLPNFFSNRMQDQIQSHQDNQYFQSYIYGFFATLLATPCSAPFLGTSISFALSQHYGVMVLIFTGVGLGLASPYLLFLINPHLIRIFPKPGPWMEIIKTFFGFILLATLVWLFYVLSNQGESLMLSVIQLVLIGLGFLFWIKKYMDQQKPIRLFFKKITNILILLMTCFPFYYHALSTHQSSKASFNEIHWENFSQSKLEQFIKNGETVFVDVTADWCFTCKFNEKWILSDINIVQWMRESGVHFLKADWTHKDDEISQFLERHGKRGIPFYALIKQDKFYVFPELLTESILKKGFKEFGFDLENKKQ